MKSYLIVLSAAVLVGCGEHTNPIEPDVNRAQSEAVASDTDLIATPGGWYHADCVNLVPNGARVEKNGRVHRLDGTSYQLPSCIHPGRVEGPRALGEAGALAPLDTGWLEWAKYDAGHAWTEIDASWHVPPVPAATYTSSQVYYTFPGIEAAFISQPVLSYGFVPATTGSPAYGGNFWSLASWHCSFPGSCAHGPPITVATGDSLLGRVYETNCLNGKCIWTIVGTDVTKGTNSTFAIQDTFDLNVAVGGALEVYNLTACNQFPSHGAFFTGVALYDQNHHLTSPVWGDTVRAVDNPNCGFAVSSTASTVNIFQNFSVSLTGPSNITSPGTYTWTSTPTGGNGPYAYQWHVHYATGTDRDLGTAQSQSLLVSSTDDDFVISVKVMSSGATTSASKPVCVFGCG
jgi:hypothetical protein